MSTQERINLEKLSETQLRNLVAKGPKGGMRGGALAAKKQLVDYFINHPSLRPARWVSPTSAPSAKRARPNPIAPYSAPAPYVAPAPYYPPVPAPVPAYSTGVIDPIRGMLYPHLAQPVINPAGETPAQLAERHARQWANVQAALDIEEEADEYAYDSEEDDEESDDGGLWGRRKKGKGRSEKQETARQYREELERRGNIRVAEHWRRADEVATFERGLLAGGGVTAVMLAEWRRQDKVREAFWTEEDRKRDEFWREEDRRRHEVWDDRRGY